MIHLCTFQQAICKTQMIAHTSLTGQAREAREAKQGSIMFDAQLLIDTGMDGAFEPWMGPMTASAYSR